MQRALLDHLDLNLISDKRRKLYRLNHLDALAQNALRHVAVDAGGGRLGVT
jgi:hypothetical protein